MMMYPVLKDFAQGIQYIKLISSFLVNIVALIADYVWMRMMEGCLKETNLLSKRLQILLVANMNQLGTQNQVCVDVDKLIHLIQTPSDKWPKFITLIQILSAL
jgi:hypothetical protein